MNVYSLAARICQVGSLILALLFSSMFLGRRFRLGPFSELGASFIGAGGSERLMLMLSALGLSLFILATILIALKKGPG